MVNDNGIITTLNPETARCSSRAARRARSGPHFASPVAADGRIFFTTEARHDRRRRAGRRLCPARPTNELGEDAYATPAFADGRVYVRTSAALYAFGAR